MDLRLRPDGRLGEVCLSLDGARGYYETRGRDWELQMLIKARVAAGEISPGRDLLDSVEPKIYQSTLNFSAVEAVSATREESMRRPTAARGMRAWTSSSHAAEFATSNSSSNASSACMAAASHGSATAEPCWHYRGYGTKISCQKRSTRDLHRHTNSCGTSNTVCNFSRTVRHTLFPLSRDELEVLARKMPAAELGRLPSGGQASPPVERAS